tara:strand:- start:127 stop:324 length:198 start_codon:yes stop_codon:yes gene_type:complete
MKPSFAQIRLKLALLVSLAHSYVIGFFGVSLALTLHHHRLQQDGAMVHSISRSLKPLDAYDNGGA